MQRRVNVSDVGDPVAALRPFDRDFPRVDLDLVESVGLFDFHRAARYLSSASVAATLHPYFAYPAERRGGAEPVAADPPTPAD